MLISDAATREHISGIVERLDGIAGVEPYAEPYWHITVKGLAFQAEPPSAPDELAPAQIWAIREAARQALAGVPAFGVQTGLVNGFDSVVFMEAPDGGQTADLNRRLMALPDVPEYPYDGAMFLPHISIARYVSSEGLPQLKECLRELRGAGNGPAFVVDEIQLVHTLLGEGAPALGVAETYRLSGR